MMSGCGSKDRSTASSVIDDNGVFWISFHSSEESILQKLEALKKESPTNLESFRIFFNSSGSTSHNNTIENAILQVFQHFQTQTTCWKQLYLKMDYKHSPARSAAIRSAVPIFQETTLHGEYRGVVMDESTATTLSNAMISRQSKMRKLTLMYTSLTPETTALLAKGVQYSKILTGLHLFRSSLPEEDMPSLSLLALGLRQNTTLEELSLVDTKLSDDGTLSSITNALKGHAALRALSFQSNLCRNKTMSALCELLADPSCHLTHLDLTHQVSSFRRRLHSEQKPFRLDRLVQGLRENKSLVSLDLTGNALDQDEFETLWKALETVPTLEHLDLSFNGIVQLPFPKMTSTTTETSRLRTLNLFGNPIYIQPPKDSTEVLLQLLQQQHPQLGFLGEGLDKSKLYTPHIQAWLDFNEAGRFLLKLHDDTTTSTPLSLWPTVLERTNQLFDTERQANVLYQLVRGLVLGPMGGQI